VKNNVIGFSLAELRPEYKIIYHNVLELKEYE